MDEELKVAFSKKEKVELFLANMDKLKAEEAIDEALYQDLRAEYAAMSEKIAGEIKSIKAKLRSEFERKANELENLQKDNDLLEARFSVGEIRAEAYRRQTKPLKSRIEQLSKEVPKLRVLVGATSSAELGGPTKVDIPELKIKKIPKKAEARRDRRTKLGASADDKTISSPTAASPKESLSRDEELVSELIRDTSKTTVPGTRHDISAEGKYRADRKNVTSGIRAAVIVVVSLIIVVIVFVVGRMVASFEDHDAPIISGVSTNTIGSSVTIKWLTNEKATSQVIVREPDGEYTLTETDDALVTKHSLEVIDVKSGVKYQVMLMSVDARGNEAVYEMEQTLILGAQVDLAPPVISDVSVSDITDIGANITWKTGKPSTSQVMVSEVGSTSTYLTEPVVSLDSNHSVILFDLKPDVTYNFTLISKDANGNQAMYDLGTMFTTLSSFPVGPQIGKRAPDFTLQTVDDKSLTLSNFRGKTIMVKFWQKACPACVREMPMMQSFLDKLPSDNVVILAINTGENATDVQDFAERWEINFPVLLDPNRKVTETYGISKTPVTFLVDSQGIIRAIKNEAFDSVDEIESTINSMFNTEVNN